MAQNPPNDLYQRSLIISRTVADKIRKFIPDFAYRDDDDLYNLVDKAISDEGLGNAERWWEDDFSYGIQETEVIQIDAHINEAKEPLFAVIKPAREPGRKIVVTVLTQHAHDRAIRDGKWTRKPPLRSRYQHAGDRREEEEFNTPFKHLEGIRDQFPEVREVEEPEPEPELTEEPERVIIYTRNGEQTLMFTGGSMGPLGEAVRELIDEGIDPETISVWAKTSIRPRVRVELEGL